MATIQEVAAKANVSVATVSRYLNNPDVVAKTTAEKVEEAIKALNYEPSILGRNLRKSESKLLIVLIPSISNPFYTEIINGIEDTAIEKGYNILLCQTDSNPNREAIYFNLIRNRLADGIISMDPTVNRDKLIEISKEYPLVQCSEYDENGIISFVTINNELAAYQAVQYLTNIGHERIALINSDEKFLYARERKQGYLRAMKESGINPHPNWIFTTENLEFDSGRQAMKNLLGQNERPTAVFAVSDILAIGALKEIHASELSVPKDIAVVGFDKINFSNMTHPTLTTVAQPMYQMGSMSANMIINKIKGKKTESIILDHELVIREST
ncbi:LacI family DNA-binding transcriptional regulator [Lentibacillus sp. L22]|uniref:LacI family DNA-binding transcriptional regulator n=1 Tax=Lentibacillus TaxID=175304 RepID=UPI0022B1C6A3|nr:LacI family DNA-binding transcriptional regulator [Lentibacillus daqui]